MKGWVTDARTTGEIIDPDAKPRPSMRVVREYQASLSEAALNYMAMRGLHYGTLRKFMIGTNERRLTIPCTVTKKGKLACRGIKKRWIGKPPADYIPRYTMVPGSKAVALYNYDRLAQRSWWSYFLIVESVMDVMLLEQMGIPAIAPFGGGGVWSPSWQRTFAKVKTIIHVADNDEAGLEYAERRREMLKRGTIVLPPGAGRFGYSDLSEAYLELGEDHIRSWLIEVQGEARQNEQEESTG
jgi:DNA primase